MRTWRGALSSALWVILSFFLIVSLTRLTGSLTVSDLVIHIGILGLFAVSLNILIGYTGLIAFGHSMFFASGAYGFGLILQTGQFSVPGAIFVSLCLSIAISLIVGVVCLKIREIDLAFLTLSIEMLFYRNIF